MSTIVTTVGTVAELQSLDLQQVPIVYLGGYASQRDGGEGTLHKVDNSTIADGFLVYADAAGTKYAREWDGKNVRAAWRGILPSKTQQPPSDQTAMFRDIADKLASRYITIHLDAGLYHLASTFRHFGDLSFALEGVRNAYEPDSDGIWPEGNYVPYENVTVPLAYLSQTSVIVHDDSFIGKEDVQQSAQFTASFSSTPLPGAPSTTGTMTVTAVTSGTIALFQTLFGFGSLTDVVGFGTGQGGVGTYQVSLKANIGPSPVTAGIVETYRAPFVLRNVCLVAGSSSAKFGLHICPNNCQIEGVHCVSQSWYGIVTRQGGDGLWLHDYSFINCGWQKEPTGGFAPNPTYEAGAGLAISASSTPGKYTDLSGYGQAFPGYVNLERVFGWTSNDWSQTKWGSTIQFVGVFDFGNVCNITTTGHILMVRCGGNGSLGPGGCHIENWCHHGNYMNDSPFGFYLWDCDIGLPANFIQLHLATNASQNVAHNWSGADWAAFHSTWWDHGHRFSSGGTFTEIHSSGTVGAVSGDNTIRFAQVLANHGTGMRANFAVAVTSHDLQAAAKATFDVLAWTTDVNTRHVQLGNTTPLNAACNLSDDHALTITSVDVQESGDVILHYTPGAYYQVGSIFHGTMVLVGSHPYSHGT